MKKKKLVFTLITLLYFQTIFAQNPEIPDSLRFAKRKEAENNIFLLKNENLIIPVKELGKKTIACISFGNNDCTIFQNRLSDYTSITFFNPGLTINDSSFINIKHQLGKFDLIICSLHTIDDNARMAFGLTKQTGEIVKYLSDSLNAIVVLFGNQEVMNELKGIEKAKSIIIASENSAEYQDLTAQLVFGGIGAKGKLNKDINEIYRKGDGLESEEGIRFKFTCPEEFSINSCLLNKKIDSIAETAIKKGAFPGCQVLAAKDGKIFFHKSYGFHTYDSINPVEKNDLYDLASITKITGPLPALMKLYDEGRISLDSKFADYWSAFRHSDKKDITIREALAHQAGFPAWIPFWKHTIKKNGKFKKHTFKPDSSKNYPLKVSEKLWLHKNYDKVIYKTIKKTKVTGKNEYLYSDLGFHLYPKIIENLSGQKYEDFITESFYKPIGAGTLTYNPLKKFKQIQIIPTEIDSFFRKKLIHGSVHDEGAAMLGGVSGNAGLFCSALDLAKIMQMYLNMGIYGGQQFISKKTILEFTHCQFPENNNRRGLGFDKLSKDKKEPGYISNEVSEKSFGHTGYTGTLCWADPENGLLYILMTNRVYPTRNNPAFFNLNIRPSIHQVFIDALKQK